MDLRFNMGVLLILSGCVVLADWERFEQMDETSSQYYIEQFKDKSKLKEFLKRGEFMWAKEMPLFKRKFKIPDESMRTVSMEIYSETVDKVRKGPQSNGGIASQEDQKLLLISVGWMGTVADSNTKTFLLDLATDVSTDRNVRKQAISSYLLGADAEETKNALFRFLVEGDRMDSMERLSIYEFARMAHDSASAEKKAAILAALMAAASKEDGKIEFMEVDKILAARSNSYKFSRQRLAMLERHSLEPPTTNLYTDRDLKAALAESRTYKAHSAISTNLAALKSRDFNVPQPGLSTNDVAETSPDHPDTSSGTDNTAKRSGGTYVFFGLTALLLLGFGAWKLKAQR